MDMNIYIYIYIQFFIIKVNLKSVIGMS